MYVFLKQWFYFIGYRTTCFIMLEFNNDFMYNFLSTASEKIMTHYEILYSRLFYCSREAMTKPKNRVASPPVTPR